LVGAALLLDDIAAHDVFPSLDQLVKWHSSKRIDSRASIDTDCTEGGKSPTTAKAKAKEASRPEIISAKRAEREAKRSARVAAAGTAAPRNPEEPSFAADISLFAPEEPFPTDASTGVSAPQAPVSMKASAPSSSLVKPHSITVPAASSVLPWYPSSDKRSAFAAASPVTASLLQHQYEYKTLESAKQAGLWVYPSTQAERARCAVFRDLHEKGYWMGGGMKFGGDWLVYPGTSFSTI
jgi:tRNA-splicing endonuclease subunit Sen34